MKFTPLPYQELFYDHVIEHPRAAIWAGMGMGKTSGTLLALNGLKAVEDIKVLVIAPKRVAFMVWPLEVEKWDDFADLSVVPIKGGPEKRKKAISTNADIHTINYELLPWLIKTVGDSWPWNVIVADEATRLKNYRPTGGRQAKDPSKINKSKNNVSRARSLAKASFSKAHRFIELTGTPAPNGLQDLWGQLWFLDRGERLGRTYSAFKMRWFYHKSKWDPKLYISDHAEKEIHERVKGLCLSLRPEDYFDLKEPIIVDVPAYMPDDAIRIYKEMEKELFTVVNDKSVDALNAAAKSMKCLQIANGVVYTEDGWEQIHDAKLDALDDIIGEAGGMPILCAYHFKTDLIRLKKRFPQGRELDNNPNTIKQWNAGEIPILFAHPASAGHGLNLQHGGNIVVMFGHWWDLEQYLQIIERIGPVRQLQAGYDRPVYIYNIRSVGTIDELVIQSRTNKRKVQDLLLEAARK